MKSNPSLSKHSQKTAWRENARIIWAITAKDLLEVVRNKNTISLLISALFIVVMYRMLPTLTSRMKPPSNLIYNAGDSALLAYLENSQTIEVWTGYESEVHMKRKLADGVLPELGLVIPADFDQVLEAGGEATLQGYVMHWVSAEQAANLRRTMEDEIARLLGRRVPINIDGNVVYSEPNSSGPGMQAAAGAVFLLTMLGLSLTPHLMLAEKQSRTLDALLVSPASESHLVIAKALTGLFYCLIGGSIALAFNYNLVMHWWLAVLALVCFSLFAISLGLMLGTKIENRGQLTLWAWVIIVPMFLPVMIVMVEGLFPDIVFQVARWIPTAVFVNVWRYAFAQPLPLGPPLLGLLWIMFWAVLGLTGVVWLVRRRDREAQASPEGLKKKITTLDPGRLLRQLLAGFAGAGRDKSANSSQTQPTVSEQIDTQTSKASSNEGWRIISAIAAKDMREALKNKLLLSILLGTAILVMNGAALPLLLERGNTPAMVVYDQGRSTLIRAMSGDESFRLALVESQEELEDIVTEGPGVWLGLIIPADFDQRAGEGQVIELDGYTAHWGDGDKIDQWRFFFEEQLGLATWGTVNIDLAGHELYPAADAGGQININLTTLILAVTTIGVALVPLLLVEEKESHTLDALLVSPAKFFQVIAGKALVGMVYCLIAAAVVILFNRHRIIHWEIVVLASLLAALFVVAVGVLVGVLSDNPTSTAFWGGPLLIVLFAPVIVQIFTNDSWSPWVISVLAWMPGTLMLNLYRFSLAGTYPAPLLWSSAAALAAMAGITYLLAGWRIQRLNR